jgi:Tat protein translocase TatC
MKVALLAGIAIALPYVAFEFWLFAAPGLRPRERIYGMVGIPLAALFFIGGMAFTYYMLLPSALPFLLNFMGIQAELRPQSYFSFITGLMFWIGVAFEFPLVVYILTSMGLIQPHALRRQWRLAVMIIAVAAAAITPTVDPVNMGLVMLPMSLLYFVSIGLSYIASAGRGARGAKTPSGGTCMNALHRRAVTTICCLNHNASEAPSPSSLQRCLSRCRGRVLALAPSDEVTGLALTRNLSDAGHRSISYSATLALPHRNREVPLRAAGRSRLLKIRP